MPIYSTSPEADAEEMQRQALASGLGAPEPIPFQQISGGATQAPPPWAPPVLAPPSQRASAPQEWSFPGAGAGPRQGAPTTMDLAERLAAQREAQAAQAQARPLQSAAPPKPPPVLTQPPAVSKLTTLRKEADAATSAGIATLDDQKVAQQEHAAKIADVGERSRALVANAANEAAAHTERMQQIFTQRDRALQQSDADIKAYADEIGSQKYDPNHLWNNTSTGGKVAFAIGALLSGIGSGMAHQENAALAMFKSAVDNDMKAQDANIQKNERALAAKKGMQQALVQRFGDQEASENALAAAKWAGTQQLLKSYEMDGLTADQKARLGEAMALTEREKQGALANVANTKANQIVQQANAAATHAVALAKAREEQRRWDLEYGLKAEHEAKEGGKSIVQTAQGPMRAINPKAAEEYAASSPEMGKVLRNIDELIALRAKNGGAIDNSHEGIQMGQRHLALVQSMGSYAGIKRVTEPELKMWHEMVGDPRAWSLRRGVGMEDPELTRLETLKRIFQEKQQADMDATFGDAAPRVVPYRAPSEKPYGSQ